jgi:hypothetical protein
MWSGRRDSDAERKRQVIDGAYQLQRDGSGLERGEGSREGAARRRPARFRDLAAAQSVAQGFARRTQPFRKFFRDLRRIASGSFVGFNGRSNGLG